MRLPRKDIRIEWRIRSVMAERRIDSAADLRRRLRTIGVNVSSQQLSRIVYGCPRRLTLDLLAGLLAVLHCEPGELVRLAGNPVAKSNPGNGLQRFEPRAQGPEASPATQGSPERGNASIGRDGVANSGNGSCEDQRGEIPDHRLPPDDPFHFNAAVSAMLAIDVSPFRARRRG